MTNQGAHQLESMLDLCDSVHTWFCLPQSLAVKKAAIGKLPAPASSTPADDKRSLEQLLSFIQDGTSNGGWVQSYSYPECCVGIGSCKHAPCCQRLGERASS